MELQEVWSRQGSNPSTSGSCTPTFRITALKHVEKPSIQQRGESDGNTKTFSLFIVHCWIRKSDFPRMNGTGLH